MLKYLVNEDFFTTYTPESVYWAGFIKADGNIYQPKTGQKRLVVCLSEKDKGHLEKLKNVLSPTRPLYYTKEKFHDKSLTKANYRLEIRSNKLCNDLETNFGIIPNKTYLDKPFCIPEEFIKEWMVGIIDGDGCIRFNKDSLIILKIATYKYNNALYIRYNLLKIGNIYTLTKHIYAANNGSFSIEFSGSKAKQILEILKTADCPKLERKWSRV